MSRLVTSRNAFDDEARSFLSGEGGSRFGVLLVIEIDEWSGIADRRGSEYAGLIAAAVVKLCLASLRDQDFMLPQPEGRFLVFLPGASADEGRHVSERLCAAVRLHAIADANRQTALRATLSIGVSASPEHGSSVDALYAAANAACARIASQGRDGAAVAPLAHHEVLHRPLSINRFAGRGTELSSLVDLLEQVVHGQPRVVSVVGASGLGTATLLRQLEPEIRVRGGAFIFAGSTDSDLPVPYAVWAAAIRSISRLPGSPHQEWRELQHIVPTLGGSPTDGHSGSQYRLLEEVTTFLRAAAAARPLVIVLDEMQWADGTSWDALEHVIEHLGNDRLMICFTSRTERAFSESAERRRALARFSSFRSIELSALTRDEVKQWLEAAFHRQPVGRDFLAFLYRQTEGNPLFISQLLRLLVEEGALWFTGEKWEWSPVSELRVPAGLPALIAHRLARFSSSTQAVLTTAAVIGHEFDIGMVVGSRAGSEAAVRPALTEGLAANFLRPSYERRRGGYCFAHEKIASVLLESVPRDRLREFHERVAQALVARGDRSSAEIAGHFDRAGLSKLAYEYALRAAAEAERVYAHAAANLSLKLAVRSASSPAELAEVRLQLAHLAEIGGRFDDVEELCDLAIEWFDGQGDARRALSLRLMREGARMAQGQPARVTFEALVALDGEAQRLGFDRERVAILTLVSETHSRLGDKRTAQRTAVECVDMAEKMGDPPLLAGALSRLGVLLSKEAPGRAQTSLRRALELYEGLADVRGQARCHNTLALVAQFENRVDDAAHGYAAANAIARVAGVPDIAGAAAMNLGVLNQRRGDYDRARELFAEAIASFATVKNSEYQLIALFNMAHCERETEHWESGAELYSATIPLAQRIGQSDVEIGAIAGEGLCFIEIGKLDAARASLAVVLSRQAERPDWFQGRELCEALGIRLAAHDGRLDIALARFNTAIAMAESVDLWAAAWLTAECADTIFACDAPHIRSTIARFAEQVGTLGYPAMTTRYADLQARSP